MDLAVMGQENGKKKRWLSVSCLLILKVFKAREHGVVVRILVDFMVERYEEIGGKSWSLKKLAMPKLTLTFLKTRIDPQKWLEMMFGHGEMDGIGNLWIPFFQVSCFIPILIGRQSSQSSVHWKNDLVLLKRPSLFLVEFPERHGNQWDGAKGKKNHPWNHEPEANSSRKVAGCQSHHVVSA